MDVHLDETLMMETMALVRGCVLVKVGESGQTQRVGAMIEGRIETECLKKMSRGNAFIDHRLRGR